MSKINLLCLFIVSLFLFSANFGQVEAGGQWCGEDFYNTGVKVLIADIASLENQVEMRLKF